MRARWAVVLLGFATGAASVFGQSTFIYDQQSADETEVSSFSFISPEIGQSFTPTMTSVGFVRLYLNSILFDGGTFHLDLRSGSFSGPIIASSMSQTFPSDSFGPVNFFFLPAVPVTPGTTYYFQPASDGRLGVTFPLWTYNYRGGTAYIGGEPSGEYDLWFREGILVPEPSTMQLGVATAILVIWLQRKDRQRADLL